MKKREVALHAKVQDVKKEQNQHDVLPVEEKAMLTIDKVRWQSKCSVQDVKAWEIKLNIHVKHAKELVYKQLKILKMLIYQKELIMGKTWELLEK